MQIRVIVHPSAKHPRVEDREGVLHIYVSDPAHAGKANAAATKALAQYYKLPQAAVQLYRGIKSRIKVFSVTTFNDKE